MGTIYLVACKDCKIVRNLDKFSHNGTGIKTRDGMLLFSNDLSEFRSALLVSFLADHKNHNVVFFDEHDSSDKECGEFYNNGYKNDIDFWSKS